MKCTHPKDTQAFVNILSNQRNVTAEKPLERLFKATETVKEQLQSKVETPIIKQTSLQDNNPAEDLFVKVRELIVSQLATPKNNDEIADILRVSNAQAKLWLDRLVDEKIVLKRSKPKGYILQSQLTLSSRV